MSDSAEGTPHQRKTPQVVQASCALFSKATHRTHQLPASSSSGMLQMLRSCTARAATARRRFCPTRPFGVAASNAAVNLVGLPLVDLERMVTVGELLSPAMAVSLFKAVHRGGLRRLEDFDDVSMARRARLAARFTIALPTLDASSVTRSADGTVKWLVECMPDNIKRTGRVETVLIPEMSKQGGIRGVLCVSSQVGCSLACTFCKTGTQKLMRNLTAADIVGQVILARDALATAAAGDPLWGLPNVSNVVFMGQGEPLLNWKAVAAACRVMTHASGLGIAPRRVTISTSGIAPLMSRVRHDLGVSLALSLHAPTDELRSRIMPINQTYPLAAVMQACADFARPEPGSGRAPRRMLWEYTLLAGVNDTPACQQALLNLLRSHPFPVAVNLIPFNPWQGAHGFTTPSDDAVMEFSRGLLEAGFLATVRWPRGRDIGAACGQLHSSAASAVSAGTPATVAAGFSV